MKLCSEGSEDENEQATSVAIVVEPEDLESMGKDAIDVDRGIQVSFLYEGDGNLVGDEIGEELVEFGPETVSVLSYS